MPRTTGLPGGPKRQGWTAVSGLTYARPSFSNRKVRRSVVENLLGAVVERFPPYALAVWIDEPHVFDVRPLDGRTALLRVPLGKDLQVHPKQLSRIRHAVILSSVCTPTGTKLHRGGEVGLERGAHALAPAVQQDALVDGRDAKRLLDLFGRPALDVAHPDDGALQRR